MLALICNDGTFLNITERQFHEWQADFPGLDVKAEIEKANVWLSRNKSKQWKTLKGFEAWLKRAHTNSPRVRADNKTKGQLAYMERVERETRERQEAEAAIPRPDAEWVGELCRQLYSSLPAYERKEPERVDWLRCDHEWSRSHYTGGEWCAKCGMFPNQWRCLRMDIPSDNFHRECHC